jgi:hypothetical protein
MVHREPFSYSSSPFRAVSDRIIAPSDAYFDDSNNNSIVVVVIAIRVHSVLRSTEPAGQLA